VSPPIPSRQEPRRLRTRAALLRAGADLLAERSIEAIPVNDIVDRAGVAKGSFFNHFADKDDFAAAIAADIRRAIEGRVGVANEGVGDPAMRVGRGVCAYVDFALSQPREARIMLRASAGTACADHPLNSGLRADLAAGCASDRFHIGGVEAGVLYVIGICQMLLAGLMERRSDRAGAVALAREIVALLLTGLGVPAGEAADTAREATRVLDDQTAGRGVESPASF
jgi:AcrR family transcriptional regulator